MLSLDRPKEAMSQIIHGAGVVYIKEGKGRGLVEASPQQQKTAYGKCPCYLAKTVMSSEWNMHFHTPSPAPRAWGKRAHTRACLLHAASPSGHPQLYHRDVTPWMIPSCILNELHNKLMFMGDLSCAGVIMSIYWLIKRWLRAICSADD